MNFTIIGGDLRTVRLAEMLCTKHDIYIYGIENKIDKYQSSKEGSITICKSLEEAIAKSKIILGPMPLSKDGENINAPFSEEKIEISKIIENLNQEKIFIAGSIKNDIQKIFNNKSIKSIDLMEEEELTVLNTIATAEGTIQVAIENTERNIHKSKVLVLGFGRVAKVVAKKFKLLDSYVTCAARKIEDKAWIETLGYEYININKMEENLSEFDIIINTVPQIILTKKELRYINNHTVIIDLASKPGGVDQDSVKELGIKYIWALALPGKVAPITSAEYMKNTINHILDKINE